MIDILEKQKWAQDYIANRFPDFADAETRFRQVIYNQLQPDTIALDAGCGHGGPVQDRVKEVRLVTGADLDLGALRKNPNLQGKMVMASLEYLPYQDGLFDLITSQWVLEHLSNPQAVFAEFDRLLKPGGRFIAITPNSRSIIATIAKALPMSVKAKMLSKLGRGEGDTFPVYYRANTGKALKELAGFSHWRIEKLEFIGAPFYFIFSPMLFRLMVFFSKRAQRGPWHRFRPHVLVVFKKPDFENLSRDQVS